MKRRLINKTLLIEPIVHESFVSTEKQSFEEVGKVIDKDESIDIPIGAICYFQSWMAEKYPNLEKPGSYHWVVPYTEIKMIEYEE